MRFWASVPPLLLLVSPLSCSGSKSYCLSCGYGGETTADATGTGGSGSTLAACADYCGVIAQLGCPNDSQSVCQQECAIPYGQYPACRGLSDTAYGCLVSAGPSAFQCDSGSGKAVNLSGACAVERVAVVDCYRAQQP